ncbi:MAG: DNA polymerase-3 subunit gamma/tau, partial [Glaciecola sp.]
ENSIFVTNDGLLESMATKGPGGLENKIPRNPLIEGDVPPWDNDTPSVVITSEPSTDLEPVHPPVQVYAEDEDDISFDDADDAPFEKTPSASQEGVQQDDAQHDNAVEPKEQIKTTEVWQDTLNAEQETEYEPSEVALTYSVEEDFESPPQKQFVDMADEIASMFGHGVNDLSNVKVTHPQIAPYLENGDKLLRAKQINKWSDFIEELGVGGLNKQLLLQSNLLQHGEHFIVRIDERNKHLDEEQHRTTITEALNKFYGKPVAFEVQYGEVEETPFKIQQQISLIRHQHAHSVVQTNDSIQELIKAFEGRIIDGSIKPR